MTRQSCEGSVDKPQERAIIAFEMNPRTEQLQEAADPRRTSLAEGIGFCIGIRRRGVGFHNWLVMRGGCYGIADWRREPNGIARLK